MDRSTPSQTKTPRITSDKPKKADDDEIKLPPHWEKVHGAIWLLGLAILFATGNIFPGILVLVAISGLVQAGISVYINRRQETEQIATQREAHLPAQCPNCGGPVSAASVRWTGTQTAVCPYCGGTVKTIAVTN